MDSIFVDFLTCYGLTFLFTAATIFERPRVWMVQQSPFLGSLLSCAFCTGFWVSLGWFAATCQRSLFPLELLRLAFAGATTTYMLDVAITWLESNLGMPRARSDQTD